MKGKSEKVKIVVKTIDMLLRKTEAKNNLEEEDIKSFYILNKKKVVLIMIYLLKHQRNQYFQEQKNKRIM